MCKTKQLSDVMYLNVNISPLVLFVALIVNRKNRLDK